MASDYDFDLEALSRFRAYLRLLAATQIGPWLEQHIDASDLVQQTFLDAVSRKNQFRGESNVDLLKWLKRILVNNLVDALRYHGRQKRDVGRNRSLEDEIFDSFRQIDALVDSRSSPSQRAATNETLLRLPTALEKLSDGQRDAIMLHHLQGLTLKETAEKLGRSEAAVSGLLHRGLKRLHELLGE
ncbi:MAG: sigma-70 family RNA polymerase sigma factor [Pirellulaceae bacterium]|nr:sigma-70 family RNA polymerase sigma factor [Planctomycetales bacterium]